MSANSVALKKSILFQGIPAEELPACLTALNAQERQYVKDAIIFHAGDRTDRMGLVLSGSVTIENHDIRGNCTVLSHIGSGQFFAETYALLPEEIMLVDVRANEDSHILFLRVKELLHESPSVSWKRTLTGNLLRICAQKNLTLSRRSFHTSPKSARERILSYLNTVSLQKQANEFDIPFDRQQLADYLNLERTSLSRELTRMKREGIIECRKNHFKLP